MLETPVSRKSAGKSLSHMLTSHGGEIFIHNLSLTRSILEDPPSISEGPGGRVTDYRITDAGELMKSNRLAPYGTSKALGQARAQIARNAHYCPLTISSTTIFNMAVLENLQRIVTQDDMTEEDLTECRKTIFLLLNMENKGDVLPVPVVTNAQGKTKTMKKEEQYRTMFNELEKYLGYHTRTERHHKVLDCLLEVRNKPIGDRSSRGGGGPSTAEGGVDVDVALRELDKYSAMTEREKNDFNMSNDGCLRSTTESPMSPTSLGPPVKKAKSMFGPGGTQGRSLLDIWTQKIEKENSRRHVPFAGQRSIGEKAKLYLSLEKKEAANRAGTPERPMNTD